jgi:hypothetical protein
VESLTSTLQVLAARLGGGDTDRRDSFCVLLTTPSQQPLTENQWAPSVFWKRLFLLVGRGGLEPPTD